MTDSESTNGSLLDRALARAIALDWEKVLWLGLFVVALLARLWQLGDRAMSHDESLHTYYSWQLFDRGHYVHDPMMHGPLLYHVTALSYFLFGVSDLTARLFAVVTGMLLVMSPLLLRKWLGRSGALATGLILALSPSVLYYSRYIRHDIAVELFTVAMIVGFFRFLDGGGARWLILAIVAVALGVTTAEMTYINGFVLLSFIVVALVVERLPARQREWLTTILAALGLGLLTFAIVANTGRLGDVTTKDKPLWVAMQFSFLVSGLCLVWALAAALLVRYRGAAHAGGPEPSGGLAELTPDRLFARYDRLERVLLPLVSGAVVLGLGGAMAAAGRSGAMGTASDWLGSSAPLVQIIGGLILAYALAAVVLGQAARVLGERLNRLLVAIGLVLAGLALVLRGIESAPGEGTVAGQTALSGGAITALLALALLVGLYGLLGWLFERYPERSLARSLGGMPLGALASGLAIGFVIYVLMYTTFFTQPQKIGGFMDSIRYWLSQHEVVRGDQPWYYYSIFAPMYEFVPFFLTLAALLVYLVSPRLRVQRGNDMASVDDPEPAARLFVPLCLAWTTGTFWIFSWAGEKMPWLLVHLVVPMAFVAGRLLADTFAAVDWPLLRRRGWQIAGLVLLVLFALGTWIVGQGAVARQLAVTGGAGDTGASAALAGWLLGLPVLALLFWGLWRSSLEVPRRQWWLSVALGVLVLLGALNLQVSLRANFVNDELATEYIVYAHGTPDDKLVYETLLDMQERLGVDRPLSIAYDDEVSWPFTWYFRDSDWYAAHYLAKKPSGALSEDVALVGSPNYSNWEPFMRNRYHSIEYRRMWWPNEGYKGLTPRIVWNGIFDAKARRNALRILLQRKYTLDPRSDDPQPKSLADWYHHANMRLYIRKDILAKLWPLMQSRPGWLADVDTTAAAPPQTAITIEQVFETGAGGVALRYPKGIELGPDGLLYVVDHGNRRVAVFSPDGAAVEEIAAGVLSVNGDPAMDPSAWGLGIGPDGAVYIADTWNHRVLKYVNGERVWSTGSFGQPVSATDDLGLFYGPRDVAVGPDGLIYVTDTGNKRIIVLDAAGTPVRAVGGSGVQLGQFNEPTSLAFDPQTGDLYVADIWHYRIQRFDRNLSPVAEWPVEGWSSQEAAHKAYIAVGPGGIVVVSDPAANLVWVYDRDGKVLGTLDVVSDARGLNQPIGVAVDDQGRVYVASSESGIVTRYVVPALNAVLQLPTAEGAEAGEEGAQEAEPVSPGAVEGSLIEVTPAETVAEPSPTPQPTLAVGEGEAGPTPTVLPVASPTAGAAGGG